MRASKLFFAACMLVFIIIVTVLERYAGTELHMNNVREAAAEIVDVEVLDVIENIRYGLELGKEMETFYGMDDTLREELKELGDVSDIYIFDKDYNLLYSTSDDQLPDDIESLEYGIIEQGNVFYSSHRINDDYQMVTASGIEIIRELRGDNVQKMTSFATVGCPIVIVILLILIFAVKDAHKTWNLRLVIMGMWILALGIYSCIINYNNLSESMDRIEKCITDSYETDLEQLSDKGIDIKYIGDMDEYLTRYTDNIDSIESVSLNKAGNLDFVRSKVTMNSIVFKYILQMLVMVLFMFIILLELRTFVQDYVKPRTEES